VPEPVELDAARAEQAGARLRELRDALRKVVLGQDEVLDQILVALLARGHVLLEGVPGTGKTLAVRALCRALSVSFRRIQFTPDLMPTDVTGVSVFDERARQFEFRRGPLFADLVLADEINRAPAKTQSALLECMQERQVTVDGVTHPLSELFTVLASQNPVEFEGTYPLPEAQLDRFLLKIVIGYPDAASEEALLGRCAAGFDAADAATFGLEPLLSREEALELRRLAGRVAVAPEIRAYVVALVRATRGDASVTLGGSPRAAVALFQSAQARALAAGRDFVVPDDVKELAAPALRHRLVLTPDAEVEGVTADSRVAAAVAAVKAPA